MRKITIPACKERGPIEICFDPEQFEVVPHGFGARKAPAYGIVRQNQGPLVAIVPTQDRDCIFEMGDEKFDLIHTPDGGVLHRLSKEAWWRKSPLQIKFCYPIPFCG